MRDYSNRLLEIIEDEQALTHEQVLLEILAWMGEAQVRQFCETANLFDELEPNPFNLEDEDEDEED